MLGAFCVEGRLAHSRASPTRAGSELRRAFDRALQALPITQHAKIWPEFISWATEDFKCVQTATVAYKRYCMFEPQRREAFADYLSAHGDFGEAVELLVACVDDPDFVSPAGKRGPASSRGAAFPLVRAGGGTSDRGLGSKNS